MSSKKMFVATIALFTAIMIVAVSLTEIDLAEGLVGEAQVLRVDEVPILEADGFDEIKIEIETKITKIEEETEVTAELTTEVKVTESPIEEKTKTIHQNYSKRRSASETVSTEPKTEESTEVIQIEESEYFEEDEEVLVVDEEDAEVVTTEVIKETPKKSMYYSMTDDEIYTFAALIYLEAGSTSYKCQCAVASVVLNLMVDEGKSLRECINTPGRFSVANRVYKTKPSNTSLEVARKIASDGPTLPTYVLYFRNNHYFSWAEPYCHIDNVYFSY